MTTVADAGIPAGGPAPTGPVVRGASPAHRLTVGSALGPLVLEADERALRRLHLPGTFPPGEAADTPAPPAHLEAVAAQLAEYLAGRRREFELTLSATGTAFQRQVWFALSDIPYGQTISYADLAARVGRPTAFRAVGQANGANPLPIVLPCHRVIATGGGIGGYGGGLTMKRWLLALEGFPAPAGAPA